MNTKLSIKRLTAFIAGAACCWGPLAQGQTHPVRLTDEQLVPLFVPVGTQWTSVHDPSVVYHPQDNQYYIFGSHMGTAKSKDLRNWTNVTWQDSNSRLFGKQASDGTVSPVTYDEAFRAHPDRKVKVRRNGTVVETDFGHYDASAWNCALPDPETGNPWTVAGNMWAPDIIYNPTLKKWCQYLSLNGPQWNSCIVLLTADDIEGPYVYQGPVVYTGFKGDNETVLPFSATDMHLVYPGLTSFPEKYRCGNAWGTRWPHAIDPCTFYDETGNLWMVYGSWFGGIYALQLDEETGLRDYTIQYGSDFDTRGNNVSTDAYFGKKIAGGHGVSGEGPYVQYIGNYYYLFLSYGGFNPDAGYEMRIFRSKNPDGPYTDAAGNNAVYNSWQLNFGAGATANYGGRIMGSYQWGLMEYGECAQGHNSAIVDEQGNAYVVYHTKFNDGTFGHQVRVHQLFVNADGWLVAAPHTYAGEQQPAAQASTKAFVDPEEIPGCYQVMIHHYRLNHNNLEQATPAEVYLNADGSITGALSGRWSTTDGTAYIDIIINGILYKGVAINQQLDGANSLMVSFTAAATNGECIWGSRMQPEYAIAYTYKNMTSPLPSNGRVNRNLLLDIPTWYGTTADWISSRPDVLSGNGMYSPADQSVSLTLTQRLSCGSFYWEKEHKLTAAKNNEPSADYRSGIVAYYNFDEQPVRNSYDTGQTAALLCEAQGKRPGLEENNSRMGQVLHQYFGYPNGSSSSYTRMTNPLKGETDLQGATLSLWIYRNDENPWDAIWAFHNSTGNGSRLYFTGNNYLGYNDGQGNFFDINHPGNSIYDDIPVGRWTLVTLTVSPAGCHLYINGKRTGTQHVFASNHGNNATDFNYSEVLGFLQTAPWLYLGYGSFWGSADVLVDDLLVYNRALSAAEVSALELMCNRVTDFGPRPDVPDAIDLIMPDAEPSNVRKGTYDLSGRRADKPVKGLYIVDGKKYLIP